MEDKIEIKWTGIVMDAGISSIDFLFVHYSQFEIGLRSDGIIVWREKEERRE